MIKKYILFFIFLMFIDKVSAQTVSNSKSESRQEIEGNFILNNAVHMYPNPVGDLLIIESKIPIKEAQIYNLLGNPIKKINTNFRRIYMGDLPAGIYMIKIHSKNNSITKKLIKR